MVLHRIICDKENTARFAVDNVKRVLACVVVSTLLVSCSGRDSGEADSGSSGPGTQSTGLGSIDEGSVDQGTAGQNTAGASSAGQASAGQTSTGQDDAGGQSTAGGTTDGDGSPGFALGDDEEVEFPEIATPSPIVLITDEELSIDGSFTLIGEANGASYPEQRYSIITPSMHGSIIHSANARQFTYAPEQDFFGTDSFVYAIDSGLAATVFIEVTNVNDAPIIFDDIARVTEQGKRYNQQLVAIDVDGDTLEFRAGNLPDWLTLNNTSGILSGTPQQSDVGFFENISFSVHDGSGLFSQVNGIRIEVIDVNDAPTINIDQFPDRLDAGELISVNLYPDDPDGDLVQVSFEPNDFLGIEVEGSTVSVIADDVVEVTEVNLVLVATDLRGRVARAIVPLSLHPVNTTGRGRTLRGRNNSGAGVHLVVLGDGYRSDQQKQFRADVETLIETMESDPGIGTHFSAWNVHMVETPSIDSGVDDNKNLDTRNTFFNSGYFCQSVQRILCADRKRIFSVAIDEYSNFNQIVLLVNDPRYGGSGGVQVAISSTHAMEIALHELGHSFAGLADEYVDRYIPDTGIPPFIEGQFANVSKQSDPSDVPWTDWIDNIEVVSSLNNNAVGVFEGAYYRADGFYRPTRNSLMRSYDGRLGPVNSEQWAMSVYANTNPVLGISPVNRLINTEAGEPTEFAVVPMFDSSIQSVEWRLGNQVIAHAAGNRPSVSLSLPTGRYELSLTVKDVSGLIRKPEPHLGVFTWNWTIVSQ